MDMSVFSHINYDMSLSFLLGIFLGKLHFKYIYVCSTEVNFLKFQCGSFEIHEIDTMGKIVGFSWIVYCLTQYEMLLVKEDN